MPRKSVAIIGAGVAGLAAASYARMNGYEVDVFEQHSRPGGLCTAWERNGYLFDGCVHWLVGSRQESGMGQLWTELGIHDAVTFFDPQVFTVIEDQAGRQLTAFADVEAMRAEMKRIAPEDAALIDRYCEAVRSLCNMPAPLKAPELMSLADKLRMIGALPKLWRWLKYTVHDFAGQLKNPFLRWAFPKMVFDCDGFPLLAHLMTYSWLHEQNAGYPIGGSLKLAQVLAQRAQELGCRIHYRTRVDKVLVEGGRAVGLRLAGGGVHQADHTVAAGDLHTLLFKLLDSQYVNAQFREYFSKLRPSFTLVLVNFGVNMDFSHLRRATGGFTRTLPEPMSIGGVSLHDLHYRVFNFDPTLAPQGRTVVACSLPAEYDTWRELAQDRVRYNQAKQEIARQCAEVMDRWFPGFAQAIEAEDVVTPVTFERYTSNYNGSAMGWMMTKDSFTIQMKRTLPEVADLYLAGHWLAPTGGLPVAAMQGRSIVEYICHNDGRRFSSC